MSDTREPGVGLYWLPGVGADMIRTPNAFKSVLAGVGAEQTIWTPAAGKRFRILGYSFYTSTAQGAITLKDNTAGPGILIIPNSPLNTPICYNLPGNGYLSLAANNVLTATGAATQILAGTIFGTEE